MAITCEIKLDKKVFYAGQNLSGTVYLSLTKKKTVRSVKIHIGGASRIRDHIDHKAGHYLVQCLLDSEMYVAGSSDGKIQMTPGVHRFKFHCKLSPNLPSTMSGHPVPSTDYEIRVVVDIPFWRDIKFIKPFTVIKPRDLSLDQKLRVPLAVENIKRFALNCLLFRNTSRPLFIDVLIPVRGYCPGETINLELDVRNSSHKNITKFSVMLKKRITIDSLYGKNLGHSTHTVASISKEKTRGCKCNQDQKIKVNLKVPLRTLPTDISTSTLIKNSYFIEIIGHVGFWHCNPTLRIPIEIGTTPPRDCKQTTSSHVVEFLSTPPPCVTLKGIP